MSDGFNTFPGGEDPEKHDAASNLPFNVFELSGEDLALLLPPDPCDPEASDASQVTVEWPASELDELETKLFGEHREALEKIRTETGGTLIEMLNIAFDKLRDSNNLFDPYAHRQRTEDDSFSSGRISWADKESGTKVRLSTVKPAYAPDEAGTKCRIKCGSDLLNGIGEKLSIIGPVELEIEHSPDVPISNDAGAVVDTYKLLVRQYFVIRDIHAEAPEIEWVETAVERTIADNRPELIPLSVVGRHLDHEVKHPQLRLPEVDAYLLEAGLLSLADSDK